MGQPKIRNFSGNIEPPPQPTATVKYREIALIVVSIPDYEKTDFRFRTAGSRYDSKLLCV
jgi:hypothetical protein